MKKIRLKAMAKINLGLDVVRKREDGYHEVRMIMQTIRMYDQIQLEIEDTPGIRVKTNLYYLPVDEDNLVYKAAKLLMEEFHIEKGLRIELKKFIPVAAGMAGGSSDAAAVLVGVNRLFHLNLSRQELMERGVKIGADVPYCILRGTALAEGIGEKLTPLPSAPNCYVLIAKPGVHVSTKFVYTNLNAEALQSHPDIDGQIKAIQSGNLSGMAQLCENVLETVTVPAYPVIDEIKAVMEEQGALKAMMSGSGPTVFGLFDDREKAKKAYDLLYGGELAKQVYLTTFFNRT
jgi:4-diphosphocytidyl-2-C-methyl-D-erythritol kinase